VAVRVEHHRPHPARGVRRRSLRARRPSCGGESSGTGLRADCSVVVGCGDADAVAARCLAQVRAGDVRWLAGALAFSASVVVAARVWFDTLQRVWPTSNPTLEGVQFGSFLIVVGGLLAWWWGGDVGLRLGATLREWRMVVSTGALLAVVTVTFVTVTGSNPYSGADPLFEIVLVPVGRNWSSGGCCSAGCSRSCATGTPLGPPPVGHRLQRGRLRQRTCLERTVRGWRLRGRAGARGDRAGDGVRGAARTNGEPRCADRAPRVGERAEPARLTIRPWSRLARGHTLMPAVDHRRTTPLGGHDHRATAWWTARNDAGCGRSSRQPARGRTLRRKRNAGTTMTAARPSMIGMTSVET
jgi:hypothetical protein